MIFFIFIMFLPAILKGHTRAKPSTGTNASTIFYAFKWKKGYLNEPKTKNSDLSQKLELVDGFAAKYHKSRLFRTKPSDRAEEIPALSIDIFLHVCCWERETTDIKELRIIAKFKIYS